MAVKIKQPAGLERMSTADKVQNTIAFNLAHKDIYEIAHKARLRYKAGFTNCKEVIEAYETSAFSISHWQLKYPGYAIITEEALFKIVDQHNFRIRNLVEYIDEVPPGNLERIELWNSKFDPADSWQSLSIIAPPNMFKQRPVTVKDTEELNRFLLEKDPIITQRLTFSNEMTRETEVVHIIITAWGAESQILSNYNEN